MTHEEAFLQEILARPDDDLPRRIFADWLLDRSEPAQAARGEFVHAQLDLAMMTLEDVRRRPLAVRERELLEAHGREWGAALSRLGCACWEYRRGFAEGVGLPAGVLLAHGEALFRLAPIRELKLVGSAALARQLAASPLLGRVAVLDLESNALADGEAELLAASPHLGGLTTLLLWSNRVGGVGVAALARAGLGSLTRLDLSANRAGDDGALALAESPLLGRLALLDLTHNQIGEAGALALAASPFAGGLGWLDLSKNTIGPAGQAALRDRLPGRVQVWG